MTREIRFRAWNKFTNEMVDVRGLAISDLGETFDLVDTSVLGELAVHDWNDIDYFVLMQYTGLKDRNGKEIYEGDVVKVKIQAGYSEHFVDKEHILPVKYLADRACWYPFNVCQMWREDDGTPKAIEVIGNIYSNPELLDKE